MERQGSLLGRRVLEITFTINNTFIIFIMHLLNLFSKKQNRNRNFQIWQSTYFDGNGYLHMARQIGQMTGTNFREACRNFLKSRPGFNEAYLENATGVFWNGVRLVETEKEATKIVDK